MATARKRNFIEREPEEEERVYIKHKAVNEMSNKKAIALPTKGTGKMTHLPSMPWGAEWKRLSYGASMQSRLSFNGGTGREVSQ